MMRIAAAALALTACSSQPEPANLSAADARDPGGDNSQALPMPAPSATVAAALPAPRPAQPRTFRDWTVACDNANRCAMASLGPDMGDFPEYTIEVARNAGPSGGYEIALATTRDAAAAVVPASIAVDGKSLPIAGDRLSGAGAQAIVEAMANGTTLDIRDGTGKSLATVSLAGASAALRFIDAAQGRAGGVTATVAKGDTPAAQVPAAPAVPVVAAPALGSAPAKPSVEQLAQMKRIGQCAMPEGAEAKPETAALGDGATLVVLPCSAGAYNVIGAGRDPGGTGGPCRYRRPRGLRRDGRGFPDAGPQRRQRKVRWRPADQLRQGSRAGGLRCVTRLRVGWHAAAAGGTERDDRMPRQSELPAHMACARGAPLMPAVIALLLAAAADPAPLQTYDDWVAGCDNARVCEAVSLATTPPPFDEHLALVVRREAQGGGATQMTVPLDGVASGVRITLTVDGKAVATLQSPGGNGGLALPLAGALREKILGGTTMALVDARGRAQATASLRGLAAALRFIGATDQPASTRRKGRRAPVPVAASPSLPVVMQPPVPAKPSRTISAKQAATLIGQGDATCDRATGPLVPKAWRLDAAHSVVTIDHPCGNGAYNAYTSVFVVDEKKRVAPARFDAPSSLGAAVVNRVVTGGWDPATRRMTSFGRGRGLGDCGSRKSFAWDGAMFRLVEQADMGECRGASHYITTWRAQVMVE